MKNNKSTIILVLMFLVGLSVLLYPTVSDYWNSKVQTHAIVDYESVLEKMEEEDYTKFFNEADEYNKELGKMSFPLMDYEKIEGYNDILNVAENGIIGYISIEKIKVELPIYHGTSDAVLNSAVGHLEGTSFPTGGKGNHTVLSAHRGLPSAKLFTDLDEMEVGDTFTVTVLDRALEYEVDQVVIVEPDEVEYLKIQEDGDFCTLLTCTPYGINSHRLLVRGTRIDTHKPKISLFIPNEAFRIDPLLVTPAVAAPMLFILLIVLLVKYRKKK